MLFFSIYALVFLAVFYNTVTNMAGVYIAFDLGGDQTVAVYPMIFYGLGNLLTVPITKPIAARIGVAKTLVFSLFLYIVFSIFCSVAPTFVLFNLYRFGLGLSSGFFYLIGAMLLSHFSPEAKKNYYTSIMITLFAVTPVLGASFGAWLGYESLWRWIFHVNEPIALFLALYFWNALREEPIPVAKEPFDPIGYFFYCLGFSCLILVSTLAQQLDWYRSLTLVALTLIGIPSILFFILWEWFHPTPFLKLRMLVKAAFSYALFNLCVLFSAYFGMIILIALWLNLYVNYTPLWIAVLVGVMAIAGTIPFLVVGRWMDTFPARLLLALALFFFALSCYYSTYFDVEVDFFHLCVARTLAGLGLAFFLPPIFRLLIRAHSEEHILDALTFFQVGRILGSSLGAALYVIAWQRRQAFFHERLGEGLTIYSQTTADYFTRALQQFALTKEQAYAQLNVFLTNQATSLALNDVFGFMGWVMVALFALLILSVALKMRVS